jgi:hypothetical protein
VVAVPAEDAAHVAPEPVPSRTGVAVVFGTLFAMLAV